MAGTRIKQLTKRNIKSELSNTEEEAAAFAMKDINVDAGGSATAQRPPSLGKTADKGRERRCNATARTHITASVDENPGETRQGMAASQTTEHSSSEELSAEDHADTDTGRGSGAAKGTRGPADECVAAGGPAE